MKRLITIVLVLMALAPLAQAQMDEGTLKGNVYTSLEIGWSIRIPEGYTVISKDTLIAKEKEGKDAMQKVVKNEIDVKKVRQLISFKKDPLNMFLSSSEPFTMKKPGDDQIAYREVMQVLYKTFANYGVKFDTSSTKEMIQGLEFHAIHITLYSPTGEALLNQIYYLRYINGLNFCVTINYSNEADKKIMYDAFKNSKFTKK